MVRTFVNVTMYPQYNSNIIKKLIKEINKKANQGDKGR
jgi:hypothetical protein